jgi:hypothetical protein
VAQVVVAQTITLRVVLELLGKVTLEVQVGLFQATTLLRAVAVQAQSVEMETLELVWVVLAVLAQHQALRVLALHTLEAVAVTQILVLLVRVVLVAAVLGL